MVLEWRGLGDVGMTRRLGKESRLGEAMEGFEIMIHYEVTTRIKEAEDH